MSYPLLYRAVGRQRPWLLLHSAAASTLDLGGRQLLHMSSLSPALEPKILLVWTPFRAIAFTHGRMNQHLERNRSYTLIRWNVLTVEPAFRRVQYLPSLRPTIYRRNGSILPKSTLSITGAKYLPIPGVFLSRAESKGEVSDLRPPPSS